MAKYFLFLVGLAVALAATAHARSVDGWSRLKLGMTNAEIASIVGQPLVQSAGGGFELWIYDERAEAIFFGGLVIGWTSPGLGPSADRSVDVWQIDRSVSFLPAFILPPGVSVGRDLPNKEKRDTSGYNLQEILKYSARR